MERRRISKHERYEILNKYGWKCVRCGMGLKYSNNNDHGGEVAHIDHVIPVNAEQESKLINNNFNLEPLCPKCNREKWDDIDPNYLLVKIFERLLSLQENYEEIKKTMEAKP